MDRQVYCAFLRGVNVNGRKMLMKDVCDMFEGAGMIEVSSILATGNIIFKSDRSSADLRLLLESVLSEHYKYKVNLFVKSKMEIIEMLSVVPFVKNSALHIYAFLCETGFENILADEFQKCRESLIKDEAAAVNSRYFFWQVPKGATIDSKFSKILSRKDMIDKFTSRNINTIEKITLKM